VVWPHVGIDLSRCWYLVFALCACALLVSFNKSVSISRLFSICQCRAAELLRLGIARSPFVWHFLQPMGHPSPSSWRGCATSPAGSGECFKQSLLTNDSRHSDDAGSVSRAADGIEGE
jgi:hypothetical protein